MSTSKVKLRRLIALSRSHGGVSLKSRPGSALLTRYSSTSPRDMSPNRAARMVSIPGPNVALASTCRPKTCKAASSSISVLDPAGTGRSPSAGGSVMTSAYPRS